MQRDVQLRPGALHPGNLPPPALSTTQGALVTFLGVVRGSEEEQPISAIDYEAFEPMALHQFGRLLDELSRRWPAIGSVRLIHSTGRVPAGQASLWVEVAAPHRAEAFAATEWLITEMKRLVPIWKRTVPPEA